MSLLSWSCYAIVALTYVGKYNLRVMVQRHSNFEQISKVIMFRVSIWVSTILVKCGNGKMLLLQSRRQKIIANKVYWVKTLTESRVAVMSVIRCTKSF